jgi:hypothetical protein
VLASLRQPRALVLAPVVLVLASLLARIFAPSATCSGYDIVPDRPEPAYSDAIAQYKLVAIPLFVCAIALLEATLVVASTESRRLRGRYGFAWMMTAALGIYTAGALIAVLNDGSDTVTGIGFYAIVSLFLGVPEVLVLVVVLWACAKPSDWPGTGAWWLLFQAALWEILVLGVPLAVLYSAPFLQLCLN